MEKSDFLKLLKIFLIIFLLVGGIYVIYLEIAKNNIKKTQEDIIYITNMVRERHMSTVYNKFNADYVAYSNYLPVDMKTKQTNGVYEIFSRFGGKINFMESPKTMDEFKNYQYAMSAPELNGLYKGLSSYIISFSSLHRRECILLSEVKWDKILPNFIALEASYITVREPYNGLDRLHIATFFNGISAPYSGQDHGVIGRRPLTPSEANRACACVSSTCTFALKLF